MLSYYFKTYELFNKEDGENMAVEDSQLYREMEKKCDVNDKDIMSMTKEVEKFKVQVEAVVKEDEAAELAMTEEEREVTSFQNDLKKQQSYIQLKHTYLSELEDSIEKWSSKLNGLNERIESAKADILRMRHILDNQSVTLEDRKQAEKEYRELEETIEMDRACCEAYLKSVYADDLQIAKLINESRANNVAYSAALIEYSNMVPELNTLNVPVNPLHKDAGPTMQVSTKMTEHRCLAFDSHFQLLEGYVFDSVSADWLYFLSFLMIFLSHLREIQGYHCQMEGKIH
jgi:chromosome segregation ATPase